MPELEAFERWMVRSNLQTIRAGTPADELVARVRAGGYERVATAIEWWVKRYKPASEPLKHTDLAPYNTQVDVVEDRASDNWDVLVLVDPKGILSKKSAAELTALIAKAMSEHGFEPTY